MVGLARSLFNCARESDGDDLLTAALRHPTLPL